MRDDPDIDAAIEETRFVLAMLSRFGLLRDGVEDDPDAAVRSGARIELTLASVQPDLRLSDEVRRYLYRLVSEEKAAPANKGRRANTVRDRMIVDMVARLEQQYRINPTRSRESRKQRSGCDIVAQVLGELRMARSYSAVAKIWERLQHEAQPEHLPLPIELLPEHQAAIDKRLASFKRGVGVRKK